MYKPVLFTLLSLLATTILARPSNIHLLRRDATATVTSPSLSTLPYALNDTANVYVCEHVNWGGKCSNISYTLGSGDCVSLDGTASSIRPAAGFSCTFYKNVFCRTFDGSESLKLKDPGSSDLTKEAGNWNDAAWGFQCFKA